jgi:hypothetical protein
MNTRIGCSLTVAALIALGPATLHAASPAGFVDFGKLGPASSGGEFVEVNLGSNLISMVAGIAKKAEPAVADLLAGLKSIRVNVIGLSEGNRSEMQDKMKAIRAQLDTEGWERIVTAQQKKEDVGVYLKTRGQEAVEGVVVTVLDGRKQAVFINIVGDLRPDKLGVIGERFNIEPLKKLGGAVQAEKE